MIKKMRFMTRREWVAKYRPERIDENACGGIMGCPGWVEKTKNIHCYVGGSPYGDIKLCNKCWDEPVKIDGKYILVNEVHDNAKK